MFGYYHADVTFFVVDSIHVSSNVNFFQMAIPHITNSKTIEMFLCDLFSNQIRLFIIDNYFITIFVYFDPTFFF